MVISTISQKFIILIIRYFHPIIIIYINFHYSFSSKELFIYIINNLHYLLIVTPLCVLLRKAPVVGIDDIHQAPDHELLLSVLVSLTTRISQSESPLQSLYFLSTSTK